MKPWKILFPLIGILLLALSFFFEQKTTAFIAKAVKADGVVSDMVRSYSNRSYSYAPVVRFVARDGKKIEFKSSVSSNPPSYRIGQKVTVFYDPENPQTAKINSFMSLWALPAVTGGVGTLFLLVSAAISFGVTLRRRADDFLRRNGTAIRTGFQSVELNTRIRVNGRCPYRILTRWENPDTSEIHVFHSKNLWFDPSQSIDREEITVFVDRRNLKKYLMDVSFLPKNTG